MENFTHFIPTEYHFGKGAIDCLGECLSRFGQNVLLTYGGGSIKRSGLYDKIIDICKSASLNVTELPGVEPNPQIKTVRKGIALCKSESIDVILSVGGGSTIDCSKAIAAGCFYNGDPWDMVLAGGNQGGKSLPLVDVMTLAATGSEFDPDAVISNEETNQKLDGKYCCPNVSICDPTFTFSVPANQTAAGSADIMSHICEQYFSRVFDSDLSEAIGEGILKSVIKNLPKALANPSDYSARANLMWDSSVACSGIPAYGKIPTNWPCHAMEHELSGFYNITHGVGLAILTPRWMRFILKKDPTVTPRFVQFARNVWGLDSDDDAALAREGIEALEDFFASVNLPSTLTELGIGDEHFGDMADDIEQVSGGLEGDYVPLTKEDIVNIYKDCL